MAAEQWRVVPGDAVQWLADDAGAMLGFVDRRGRKYVLPSQQAMGGMLPQSLLAAAANQALDPRIIAGAKCDGKVVYDANVTGSVQGSMLVSSATAVFSAADLGKPCVHMPKSANGNYPRYGFITEVVSPNSVVVSVSGVTTGAGQQFVWGSDDTDAINSALQVAAALRMPLALPAGITTCIGQVVVPTGVTFFGMGRTLSVAYARDFEYWNSSLVLVGYVADAGGFVKLGNNGLGNTGANSGTRGCAISGMNVDAMNNASYAIGADSGTNFSRGHHIVDLTALRGTNAAINGAPSTLVDRCTLIGQQRGRLIVLSGDSRMTNSWAFGAGATFEAIKVFGSDVLVQGNHIWKDSDTAGATGPAVLIDPSTGGSTTPAKGSIAILNNQFDTSFGPHVKVNLTANSFLRALAISNNTGFQNDAVPNGTYPWIELVLAAGSELRALTVMGNIGQGSWNNPATGGQYTSFINGAGISGTVRASTVVGNVIDNCAALYASFTPTYSAGNHVIAGASGTVVTTG